MKFDQVAWKCAILLNYGVSLQANLHFKLKIIEAYKTSFFSERQPFFFNTKLMLFCQNNWHTYFSIVRFIQINCKWLVKGQNRPKWFYLEILINKVLFCEIQKNLYLVALFLLPWVLNWGNNDIHNFSQFLPFDMILMKDLQGHKICSTTFTYLCQFF